MADDPSTERAQELFSRARTDPASVDPAAVRDLANADSSQGRWYGIQAYRHLVSAVDLDVAADVPTFVDGLDDEDARVRSESAMTLGEIATHRPAAVESEVETMAALVDDDQARVRTGAVDFLYRMAAAVADPDEATDPAAIEPAIPALRDRATDDDAEHRDTAVRALGLVSSEFADALAADFEGFLDAFETAGETDVGVDTRDIENPHTVELVREANSQALVDRRGVRNAAARTLVAVARADPDRVERSIETVADHLGDPNPGIRRDVLRILDAVGRSDPEAVAPYLDDVAESLDDHERVPEHAALVLVAASEAPDVDVASVLEPRAAALHELVDHDAPAVRGAAAGLLSHLAETAPDAVDPDRLRPLLDDELAYVRGNAVWALAPLEDAATDERLREMAGDDPDSDVRDAAEAALAER